MKRSHAILMQAAAAAFLAFGLTNNAAAQGTVKIGLVQPLTGAFAAAGTDVVDGARIAADEINAAGGVLGMKLELVIEDTRSNPTEAASVTEKLIVRDKVPVLMGASASTATLAAMPKLMEYKVPMLVETFFVLENNQRRQSLHLPHRAALRTRSRRIQQDRRSARHQEGRFPCRQQRLGRGTADEFRQSAERSRDRRSVWSSAWTQGAQDMNAQLAKIKGSGADTLFVTDGSRATVAGAQAGNGASGCNMRIISTGGSQNPDQLIKNVGKAADGTLAPRFLRTVVARGNAQSRRSRKRLSPSGASGACPSAA